MPMTGGGGVGGSGVRRKLQSLKVDVIVAQKSSELPSAFLPPSPPPLPSGDKWWPIPNKKKKNRMKRGRRMLYDRHKPETADLKQ